MISAIYQAFYYTEELVELSFSKHTNILLKMIKIKPQRVVFVNT